MRNCQSKKRAFTLIELLVVIAIMAITTSSSINVNFFRFIFSFLIVNFYVLQLLV
ncbi:MAG: type II secretion system protein [Lentisphaerae bacterium]|nr:type II secretion system protein [Lentisphaerota bacterium]